MKVTRILATVLFLAVATAANAVTLTADRLIGYIIPGTPSDPANESEMVNFIRNGYNNNLSLAVNGLGDNPNDPQAELYTLTQNRNSHSAAISAVQGNGNLPLATMTGAVEVITSNPIITILQGSFQYVLAKYGQDAEVFFIGGLTGEITLANLIPGNTQGLSHYVLFNPAPGTSVPDGGTTMTLLGLGCLCVGALRRRILS